MNTKRAVFINIICAIVLAAAPVCTFASPSLTDKPEQTASQNVTTQQQSTSEEQEINQENFNNKIEAQKDKIPAVYAPADYYNWLPKPDDCNAKELYERKTVLNKSTKTHLIFSKINKILQAPRLKENSIANTLRNKLSQLEQFIGHYQTLTTIDFAPYYYIMPSVPDDYVKKIISSDDITNIEELLTYNLTIQKNLIFKMSAPKNIVTSRGVTDLLVLMNAPSPQIKITGKPQLAKLVIDIRNNTLYKYDKNGFPVKAYLVATGAYGTRTMSGLRIVTYKERFPYAGDPTSKRAQDPYSYGPYIIFMNAVNPKTGRQYVVEQLLHGNGSEYSIGKKVSHGCVRTNNSVMKYELSKEVKRGDYILLINPDIG